MADIVKESGSPKGSLYFHFPEGKEQLASLALADAGKMTCEALQLALFSCKTIKQGLQQVFSTVASELEKSSFRAGCPIGTVAAEAPQAPLVMGVVAATFESWQAVISERLKRDGLRERRAEKLAEFVLALFEGALVLAKARRSAEPLTNALEQIERNLQLEGLK